MSELTPNQAHSGRWKRIEPTPWRLREVGSNKKQTWKTADKVRLKLKNVRLDIQRQEKANNKVLKQIKKGQRDKTEKLIRIIHP